MAARDSLAWTKSRMGYHNDAENLLYEGISRLSGSLGSKHPAVTNLRASYASMLSTHNNLVSAEIIERQLLQEWKAYGEEHPYFIEATRELAVSCRKLRKFSEADNLSQRAIEASKVISGPTDRKVANTLSDYACLMTAEENFRDARVLLEGMRELSETLNLRDEILSLRTKVFGPSHPKTITATYNLAGTYSKLGDSTKALYIYRDCLEKRCSVLGELHLDSLKVREKIGAILYELGHFTECKHYFDELLVTVKSTKGENRIEMTNVLHEIANLYLNQHQYAQAAEQFRYTLQILEIIGGTSEKVLENIVGLADCYRLGGEFERAEIELQAAIEKGQEVLEHEQPILYAQSRLAWTYLFAKKHYEAENLARTLLQKLEEKEWGYKKDLWRIEEVLDGIKQMKQDRDIMVSSFRIDSDQFETESSDSDSASDWDFDDIGEEFPTGGWGTDISSGETIEN